MLVPETASNSLVITLFGPMKVLVEGYPLPPFRSRKALWALALLTLRHDRPVEREWLAATLWPDIDQTQAFANLRPILSELRKAMDQHATRLQAPDRHTLRLDLTGAQVDLVAFDAAVTSKKLADLEMAVELYKGPLLEGCPEEWVFQERNAREQACLRALLRLGEAALEAGNYSPALGYFQRAATLDPWSDEARRGWMAALAGNGDRNAALQVYREFVEVLRSDPQASPEEETTVLYVRLRAEARGQSPKEPVALVREAGIVGKVTGYLPSPLTELVGREEECLEVGRRLRQSRLVTLTGMGGIGKTRLAIEVAREVAGEYTDGVWLVGLEALSEGKLVARQIASVLGLREDPGRSLLQSVTEHISQKQLLLVLDNCEHLLGASKRVAAHLLQHCAGIHILATSRESLGLSGELTWPVPSLAVPSPSHLPTSRPTLLRVLMGYESVQLFVDRAQSVQKTFTLTGQNATGVAKICHRLEGIPLAIELAAARVKALTVEQIAARLDDHLELLTGGSRTAMSRQKTLRATLDWSYSLLEEKERVLLERLSVFVGGWPLEAAEEVCSTTTEENGQVLDLLSSLVDKSLVILEKREGEIGGRYRLLEMVRQYGAEKLKKTGEVPWVKARHRDCFLALAEQAAPELLRADQGIWLERLEAERANLRAALDWCRAEESGAELGLQMAGALYRFWEMHGHYSEGRAYLLEAVTRDGANERTNERARALNGAGVLGYYQGDYKPAQTLQEESLAIFRELSNRQGVAWTLNDLGDVAGAQGNRDAARSLYEESLAIFRELGNRQGMASLLHHLGRVLREQGDYPTARTLYEESLAIFRELGNRQSAAWSLHHLGNVTRAQGDYVAAQALQEESLAIFRELGNLQGVAWTLNDLGDVAGAQGNRDAARSLYEESLAIFRELGNRQGMASLLHHLGRVLREQGDYPTARTLYEESLAIFRELGNRQGEGWVLNGLARVAFEQGRPDLAQTLYEEGMSILEAQGDKHGFAESQEGLAAIKLVKSELQKGVHL